MKKSEIHDSIYGACARLKYSRKTAESYVNQIRPFAAWMRANKNGSVEQRITRYLDEMAPRVSASTQALALNAIAFFYKQVLQAPFGQLEGWRPAQRPKRLPVWLNRAEFDALAVYLQGAVLEIAQMMFGAGPRLKEALKLRVRDLDFHSGIITIRGGKGDKDRNTCFPKALMSAMISRLNRLRTLWEYDRSQNTPGVWLPDDVGRKYPNYGKDWPWQWVFPARNLSTDPETKIVRRHHLHEDTLGKALFKASRMAGLCKRVTAHVLRHSFATEYLNNGGSIHKLQALLGHRHIETTEIYLHCVREFVETVRSPLDMPVQTVPTITYDAPMIIAFPTSHAA